MSKKYTNTASKGTGNGMRVGGLVDIPVNGTYHFLKKIGILRPEEEKMAREEPEELFNAADYFADR